MRLLVGLKLPGNEAQLKNYDLQSRRLVTVADLEALLLADLTTRYAREMLRVRFSGWSLLKDVDPEEGVVRGVRYLALQPAQGLDIDLLCPVPTGEELNPQDSLAAIAFAQAASEEVTALQCRICVTKQLHGKYKILVSTLATGKTFPLDFRPTDTVHKIMSRIEDQEGIPADEQRILFQGKRLSPDDTLADCGVQPDDTLDLGFRVYGGMFHQTSGRDGAYGAAQDGSGGGRVISILLPNGRVVDVPALPESSEAPSPNVLSFKERVRALLPPDALLTSPPASSGPAAWLATTSAAPAPVLAGDLGTCKVDTKRQCLRDGDCNQCGATSSGQAAAAACMACGEGPGAAEGPVADGNAVDWWTVGWQERGPGFWAPLLRRENTLRLSDEVQVLYAAAEASGAESDWMQVTEQLQRRVLHEAAQAVGRAEALAGPEQEAQALTALRQAPHRFPELKPLCVYHRAQRSREGHMRPGDRLPGGQLLLVDLQGQAAPLLPPLPAEPGPSPSPPGLLVVFGGSYSWPPFRALLGGMQALAAAWAHVALFRIVYISEAHATDEWPISSARCNGSRGPVDIRQAVTTPQRCAAAASLVADFKVDISSLPVLVDPLLEGGRQPFDDALAPWPIRFYVLERSSGTLLYISRPRQATFDLGEVRELLQAQAE